MSFISRTVFIYTLGTLYLGVNGLFTNVLSVLSLSELGIGIAITFSLYKPLADNDLEKIKALMKFYKNAYKIIALVVFVIGMLILPFLGILIKGGEGISHINFIYCVFLFNTTISYLFTYKRTLLIANQQEYRIRYIMMIINFIKITVQIIILLTSKNYYFFIITESIFIIVLNIFINRYIDKKYPYINDSSCRDLDKQEKYIIIKNIKAMMFHKIGELAVNQTDNIIISSFISVSLVGIVSNYVLIITAINVIIINFFKSATASIGHLIATENEESRLRVFNVYNFMAFYLFGFATVCLINLLNPFIILWIGKAMIINWNAFILIIINFYLVGMRIPVGQTKTAAGIYNQDKYVPLVQAFVNLLVSVIAVQYWGLTGVFFGTLLCQLVLPVWYKPIILYRYAFKASPFPYFIKYFQYALVTTLNILITYLLIHIILDDNNTWFKLFSSALICFIVTNITIILFFNKSIEFKFVIALLKQFYRKVIK